MDVIPQVARLDERELSRGFAELDALAKSEYHRDLGELLADPNGNVDPTLQIARLVGVVVKEPFAAPVDHASPSPVTGAYRAWELVDAEFHNPTKLQSWQFGALRELAREHGVADAHQLAVEAQHERGFFGYFARSAARYICGDDAIRQKVSEAVDEARKAGLNVSLTSPDVMVGSAGLSLGVLLVQVVPVLGFVGAPIIAGFVLILYRIGVDAFCDWSRDFRVNSPIERA